MLSVGPNLGPFAKGLEKKREFLFLFFPRNVPAPGLPRGLSNICSGRLWLTRYAAQALQGPHQCVTIILIGCLSRRLALFSPSEAAGISAFVGRLAMPGLLFLAMAELEIDSEAWRLVAAISAAKGLVFAITAGLCLSALCRRTSDSMPKATWLGRAGLYAIATTQSNDFALGLPLCAAIWGGRFNSTIYLAAPVQLALLNPLGFALLEAGAEAGVEAAEARLLPSGGGGGATGSRRQLARVCSKVLRSPLVFSVVVGSAVRAALQAGGYAALPELVAGVFEPFRQAFAATALVTLGLSLRTSLKPLASEPLCATGVLCGKARDSRDARDSLEPAEVCTASVLCGKARDSGDTARRHCLVTYRRLNPS